MRNIFILSMPVVCCLLLISCGSKKDTSDETQNQSDEPVFGIYKFDTKGKVQIQLNADSTAESDISNTDLQKTTGVKAVNNHGTFTFHNDSIFINWKSGRQVKSKFVKKDGTYSFRVGSTTYKRKL
ncbi:MAG: hypothetical protein SGI96_22165 [Bacteroidota bacterium]|nr:hypothetical protein [Bacteroidota bacterium]